MRNIISPVALSAVLLLSSQSFAVVYAEEQTDNNKATIETENTEKNETAQTVSEKLIYKADDYTNGDGRILGKYPVVDLDGMDDLNKKIRDDIELAISNLSPSSYDNDMITFSIDDDIKLGFAKITIKLDANSSSSDFVYYVDKTNKRWTTSESEANAAVKAAEEKRAQEEQDKQDETSGQAVSVITMVPLRVNAEKAGWKVDWEQKTAIEPSKAILTKGNSMIKVLVDPNTSYDVIINRDMTKVFIETDKLDRPAELQDDTLYVPSTFIEKISKDKTESSNTK